MSNYRQKCPKSGSLRSLS